MKADGLDDPDVTIECPYYVDVIYTDTKCLAQTPEQQVKRYTPHYDKINGIDFAVDSNQYEDKFYLSVEIASCGNTELGKSALDATRKWLKSVYLDPNDYTIELVDICKE